MKRLMPSLALIALVSGCDPATCSASGKPATLEIGTGEDRYEPLDTSEPTMEIVHGSQGGYHVLVSLQATYLDASDLMLGALTGSVDGEVLGESRPWLQMRCNPQTKTLQTWGTFLIWDAQPEDLHGRTAVIQATVTDIAQTEATDQKEVLLWDPLLE